MYIIMKASRVVENPKEEDAYRGISCDEAKVPLGKVYRSRKVAERHAEKLAKVNPVGFVVVEIGG